MRILFICSGNHLCRGLMGEAILRSFDQELWLEVAASGLKCSYHSLVEQVLEEVGLHLNEKAVRSIDELSGQEFDVLITLCDGTPEEVRSLPFRFNRKFHLGFRDPWSEPETEMLEESYRQLRDELFNELDYFYTRILSRVQMKNQP